MKEGGKNKSLTWNEEGKRMEREGEGIVAVFSVGGNELNRERRKRVGDRRAEKGTTIGMDDGA
ncbi:unnamed protein product [Sphenostylis stenocarpa]|uniref:Uncharacterized protein n=1 Tax=Sphenostylis stenocarpa TaxID=92480 RepID=A0AA86SMY5_9FABA|nr:unnamed protein product [Sphenostylis stenocarpa]